ncbi:caspase family protein [uncultured Muribaculum sp.]|uniref:caspase family protein n=1 Tax=uncultured Muribaculum sp. TaxID=1918613 RepID=UPI00272FE137|nr:caspase family protein [uncultured Muribaculum sp.]
MSQSKTIVIISAIVAMMVGFSSFSVEAQTKRALLVGVSDYGNPREDPDKWANISGANDVALLSPLFKKQGFAVTTLVDKQATYANITGALKKVVKDAKKGDMVYLHFSMHGQPFEDLNGDEIDGWDEALIPVDAQMRYVKGKYEGKNHLLDDEMEKYFEQIRSKIGATGELFVVLDACHSGTASRGDGDHVRGVRDGFTRSGKAYTPNRTKETNDYFKVPTVAGQSPVTFLEACRSYQQNKEVLDRDTKTWYGSLSYYVAKAMANHQIDKSGKWIDAVKTGMAGDRRVRKQNMVIETSK